MQDEVCPLDLCRKIYEGWSIELTYIVLWSPLSYPQLMKQGRIYWSQQTVDWAVGETLCLKLLPQFSSNLNETCYIWPLCCVDVHEIIFVEDLFLSASRRQVILNCSTLLCLAHPWPFSHSWWPSTPPSPRHLRIPLKPCLKGWTE